MTDAQFADRARVILRNMSLERTGWRGWLRRWAISDEPLRNDAANLLRESGFEFAFQPKHTRMVGDDQYNNEEAVDD